MPHPVLRRAPLALALSLCLATSAFARTPKLPAPAGPVKAAATPLPGDDFFRYANGDWLNQTEIPADRNSWSAGAQLVEDTNERIVKLIEALGANGNASSEMRQVNDFYRAMMNEAAIEQRGLAGLQPLLQQIGAIQDKTALAHALGASLRVDVDPLNSTHFSTGNLFGLWIAQDLNNPDQYAPYLLQGGLGLPDRVFYLGKDARMSKIRSQYQQYIADLLLLSQSAGNAQDAHARAARVMALETKIAQSHASREDSEDIKKANNRWQRKDFAQKAAGLDWNAFFDSANLSKQQQFMVWHPGALKGEAALVAKTDLNTWKDFLRFHTMDRLSDALPQAFVEKSFAFHGQALNGTPQMPARWKRALQATNDALPDAIGKLYVERYFPPENKVRVQQMVSNIISAFSARIDKLAWMSPATREQAKAKLKTLVVGVGYPDKWHSYEGLQVAAEDALGNVLRSEQFHTAQEIAKLGQPVDRNEWSMPAQIVNAVNMPLQNAINFPAAILQPPFFDPNASDAANYGATGATIGHEISHSFDDQGAQFDANGKLRNWWSKADLAHFSQASKMLAAQYSAYRAFPDLSLNGNLNLSENLADLAGLAAAHDALIAAQAGKAATPDLDQQFFLGYAQSWRNKMRENAMRQQILTDGHSPAPWRAATVRNLDAWYKAFNVQPGQSLYLAPQQRVRVW